MDRITRKELKTDKFALEVEHTVGYLSEHKQQVVRYGIIAGVVLALIIGIVLYRRHAHSVREQALSAAMDVMQAPVGQPPSGDSLSFSTPAERDQAAVKALTPVANDYAGSDEGVIARYYLGTIAADQGNLAEAEKNLREAADRGDAKYSSLAKLALANVYKAEGKTSDAEKLLRELMEKPTIFVSKEEATIALARLIGPTRPDEARKLLDPLKTERPGVSRAALMALSELPQTGR